jgi:hypothetical protein
MSQNYAATVQKNKTYSPYVEKDLVGSEAFNAPELWDEKNE